MNKIIKIAIALVICVLGAAWKHYGGGENTWYNVVAACIILSCFSKKKDKTAIPQKENPVND